MHSHWFIFYGVQRPPVYAVDVSGRLLVELRTRLQSELTLATAQPGNGV